MVYEPLYHALQLWWQTRDFGGVFILSLVYIFHILGAFLINQLFHSRLLDMRLVIANSVLRASLAIYHVISNARSWNNCQIFPNFQNFVRCEKDLKDNKDNSRHLGRKYARIFVLGDYLFLVAHSFVELRSRKTVRFSEQIMSADKYPSIFSRQMATIVYIS